MNLVANRAHQLFPVLDAIQIETAKRFASGPATAPCPSAAERLWVATEREPLVRQEAARFGSAATSYFARSMGEIIKDRVDVFWGRWAPCNQGQRLF